MTIGINPFMNSAYDRQNVKIEIKQEDNSATNIFSPSNAKDPGNVVVQQAVIPQASQSQVSITTTSDDDGPGRGRGRGRGRGFGRGFFGRGGGRGRRFQPAGAAANPFATKPTTTITFVKEPPKPSTVNILSLNNAIFAPTNNSGLSAGFGIGAGAVTTQVNPIVKPATGIAVKPLSLPYQPVNGLFVNNDDDSKTEVKVETDAFGNTKTEIKVDDENPAPANIINPAIITGTNLAINNNDDSKKTEVKIETDSNGNTKTEVKVEDKKPAPAVIVSAKPVSETKVEIKTDDDGETEIEIDD
ncbi:MAG: hypothetical protein KTR14_01265 [Vampirovibrio sp.]|nr:hypothetical protein [Vampirovibrio sp.]